MLTINGNFDCNEQIIINHSPSLVQYVIIRFNPQLLVLDLRVVPSYYYFCLS